MGKSEGLKISKIFVNKNFRYVKILLFLLPRRPVSPKGGWSKEISMKI